MSNVSASTINSITVDALFGRFNYKIPLVFPLCIQPGLVIITAPNGYGKSTILKLLNDVAHGDYLNVSRTNFGRFEIETSESILLVVERIIEVDDKPISRPRHFIPCKLRFSLVDLESSATLKGPWEASVRSILDEEDEDDRLSARHPLSMVERKLPFLRRVGPAEWRDMRDGNILSRLEVMRLIEGRALGGRGLEEEEPDWLTEFREQLKILYISANRLRVESDPRAPSRYRNSDMVEVWAERIREQIRDVIRRYAERGRRLEQDFPSKIISALRSKKEVSQDDVAGLVEDVRLKEHRYQTLGLVSEGQTVAIDKNLSDKSALVVLKAYLEDIKSKFEALDDTAERLEIFVETINSMLLFKNLRLSADSGFQIISDENNNIPLGSLSSGEQHLVVLLGELVFGSTGGATILLDEPEISFHPEWQERFPKVLTRIIQINDCAIVMATHSPTLIQDSWDSVVELAEQVHV